MAQGQQHELSFMDVSRAVSLVTGLAPELQEIVNLSSSVHSKIRNDPNLRTASLGQDSIKSLIYSSMPPEVLELMDPARRAEAQRAQAERGNVTGSAYAQAFAMSGAQAALAMRDRIHGGSHGTTSARFDSVANIKGDWNSPAGQAYMREFAIQNGLSWAANNPDLLRLGPSAITALADVQLKQENYQRLTKGFGLSAKETVETAKKAKQQGIDLNEATETADAIRNRLPAAERKAFGASVWEFLPNLDKPEAQEKFNGQMDAVKAKHPEMASEIEKLQRTLKSNQAKEHGAANKADAHAKNADAKESKAVADKQGVDATLNALNDPPASATSVEQQVGDRPAPEKAQGRSQKPKARQASAAAPN